MHTYVSSSLAATAGTTCSPLPSLTHLFVFHPCRFFLSHFFFIMGRCRLAKKPKTNINSFAFFTTKKDLIFVNRGGETKDIFKAILMSFKETKEKWAFRNIKETSKCENEIGPQRRRDVNEEYQNAVKKKIFNIVLCLKF